MPQILIQNATIYDGSGERPFLGDVSVSGDRIAQVADREAEPRGLPAEADRILDGTGLILTPGFIDVHSHSDVNILANLQAESKLRQGITTEIVGNCGSSAFPARGTGAEELRRECGDVEVPLDWTDAKGYFARLDSSVPAVNIASFVGHSSIRADVVGYDDRPPTAEEMQRMCREVEVAMEAGALGVSTGLIYAPGIFSDTSELADMQRCAAKHGGMYSSHVRGEGDTLLEATEEFLAICKQAACPGQFSHFKASGSKNWGKVDKALRMIEDFNRRGGRVHFDKYPYIASSTSLSSLMPRWARDGGVEHTMERLRDPRMRTRIARESAELNEGKDGWDSVIISNACGSEFTSDQGKTIGQIARERDCEPSALFVDILLATHCAAGICNFTMSQEETDSVIVHPLGMIGTDSACRAPYGVLSKDRPHPRSYGSFGRFFCYYVKERGMLSIEEAVAKVTAFSADSFGLKQRGRIQEGCFADLLLIDWDKFQDQSDFANPHQYCAGIEAIVVNGKLTVYKGEHTGQRGGRVIRRGK